MSEEIEKQSNEIENEKIIEQIKNGFKINFMKMKNGDSGEVLWEVNNFDFNAKNETLPKEILNCSEVIREVNFSSEFEIKNLWLIQNYYLYNEIIEVNKFNFGFVIPQSTNNWEQIIKGKDPEEMLPYDVLSGNLIVETIFFSNESVIIKNRIKIYYK
jgi:retinal rod rhodopsin-sensitive cGMP 3',5'-cyclic phosphodiesterase subunit delta